MTGWSGYQPPSFLWIEDEAADYPWPPFTLTGDPARAVAPGWALAPDAAGVDAALAPWFCAVRIDERRIRFLREIDEPNAACAVTPAQLQAARRTLLALAEHRLRTPPAPCDCADPHTYTHTFTAGKAGRSGALRRARARQLPDGAAP